MFLYQNLTLKNWKTLCQLLIDYFEKSRHNILNKSIIATVSQSADLIMLFSLYLNFRKFMLNIIHYKCLQGFTGGVHRFSLQYLWKGAVRITEKPYTHQRERLRILWRNPVIFTDCGEIL